MAISAILITAAATAIALTIKESFEIKNFSNRFVASRNIWTIFRVMAESDWFSVYDIANGTPYYLTASARLTRRSAGQHQRLLWAKLLFVILPWETLKRFRAPRWAMSTESALTSCNMEIGGNYIANDPSALKITVTVVADWGNRDRVFHNLNI